MINLGIFKRKLSLIKLFSLTGGFLIALCILLYVNYELSFDTWSPKLAGVYRVSLTAGSGSSSIATPQPLSQFILENDPSAMSATRVLLPVRGEVDPLLSAGNKEIYRNDLLRVDTNFLSLFPYHFLYGDAQTALSTPKSIVITYELMIALFGKANPIGQTIQINKEDIYSVSGVISNEAYHSHLSFSALVPLRSKPITELDWNMYRYATYVAFRPGYPVKGGKENLHTETILNKQPSLSGQNIHLEFMSVKDIHLHSSGKDTGRSSYNLLLICLLLAVLILIVTVVNYINLTIATSITRHKELFVKRIVGADTKMIFFQLLFESFVYVLTAVLLALLLIMPIAHWLGNLLQVELVYWSFDGSIRLAVEVILLILLTTLLSGGYPAYIFSRYSAARLSKFGSTPHSERSWLRKFLLGLQFTVSIFFVCVSAVVFTQVHYLIHMDYGFVPDQVFRYQASYGVYTHYDAFKGELLTNSAIRSVSRCSNYPGDGLAFTSLPFSYKGESHTLDLVSVDYDYFKTLGIQLTSGRDFNRAYGTDSGRAVVINESCAREIQFDPLRPLPLISPCDRDSSLKGRSILGVVKDYNAEGFQTAIRPTVYTINSECTNSMTSVLVKVSAADIGGTSRFIENTWKDYNKVFPIRPTILGDEFLKYLETYQRMEKIFFIATFGLILISLLGIFSLASFELDQRWRELSIRKVLGASLFDLFGALNRRLVFLLLIANIVALPLAWYCSKVWLNNFIYRIQMPYHLYALIATGSILIGLAIANARIFKIISLNPSQKLREN